MKITRVNRNKYTICHVNIYRDGERWMLLHTLNNELEFYPLLRDAKARAIYITAITT